MSGEMPTFRVQFLDPDSCGYWMDMPGGFSENQHQAEKTAEIYSEKSGRQTRIIGTRGQVLWQSASKLQESDP